MGTDPRAFRALLRAGRWFHGLPDPLQDALLGAAAVRDVPAGTRLFSRGDPPSGLYAVLDGAVRVTATSAAGKEALLILLEPPAWFGEVSVFDGQPRTHDAIADGEARVLQVPQPALDAILAAEPRWWRDLGLLLAGKLRLAFVAMEDLTTLPIAVRLARRLAMMAEGYGEWQGRTRRVLEVKQEQLAAMLSTSRQTVNGVLKDLEAQGIVRLAYGQIELVDLDALHRAARA